MDEVSLTLSSLQAYPASIPVWTTAQPRWVNRVRTYRGHPEKASGRHQGRWRMEKCVKERGGAGKEKLLPEQSVRLSLQAAVNSCL